MNSCIQPHSNLMKDFCEKFVGDVQLEGLIPRSPASPLTLLLQDESLNLSDHMLAQVPRLDSSGAESSKQEASGYFLVLNFSFFHA